MCFFGGGGGAPGPQSSADKAKGGYTPPVNSVVNKAVQNQQTADKNTMRRADSYGSQKAATSASASTTTAKNSNNAMAVAGGQKTMNALNDYNKSKTNKKTILGS
tara:strand:- start:784 stop:1098 length:315 start_codon:yes stop_codon:yes gene_type:complete